MNDEGRMKEEIRNGAKRLGVRQPSAALTRGSLAVARPRGEKNGEAKSVFALLFALLLPAWLINSGCRATSAHTVAHEGPTVFAASDATGPFLSRGEYDGAIARSVGAALEAQGFRIPWIVCKESGSTVWFISERLRSEHELQRVFVRVSPKHEVEVRIDGYAYAGSDWAAVGRLFADFGPEAATIKAHIESELKKGTSL
jgi:hypothetical protein